MNVQLPQSLQEKFDRLDPKQKQMLVWGSLVGVVALALFIFSGDEPPQRRAEPIPAAVDILTDSNTRQLGIEALGSRITRLETEAAASRNELELLRSQQAQRVEGERKKLEADEGVIADRVRKELLAELSSRGSQLNQAAMAQAAGLQSTTGDPTAPVMQGVNPFALPAPPPAVPPPAQTAPGQAPAATGTVPASDGGGSSIRTLRGAQLSTPSLVPVSLASQDDQAMEGAPPVQEATLLPGTIITGRLLTGVDAPTHKGARSEPYPVLVQVTMDSILPSLRRYDISECFVVAGGYGDLSSERVLFRTDTLSCVTADDTNVAVPLKGFVVGEDGKNGLRGKLVSKQGALLARSTAAGVLEGFSSVFRRAQVPVIASAGSNESQFQSLLSNGSIESGLATGVGSALDRLAQYYLDLANEMHAVIEIGADRDIEIVLTEGVAFPDLHLVDGEP